ncbi:MAG: hypothetical protein GX616_13780 [Planctomycetes bacterium]|nr:hypothetical protein [Planctomycetota bacterium]
MSEWGRDCQCRSGVSRREALKIGAGTAGLLATGTRAQAEPGHIPPQCKVPPAKEWFDQLLRPGKPITYSGKQLEKLVFPIGGIGTGTIWLHGSGRLVNWQIFNNIQKDSLVDDTFFAVRAQEEGKPPVVRVLQQEPIGPFMGIRDVSFVGEYPFGRVSFTDPELPVQIELEAFNPLIPLNERDSAIPCAIFTLRATNKTDKPVQVSLLSSLQNAVGHIGRGASRGVTHESYGGNLNFPLIDEHMTAVILKAQPGKPAEFSPPVELIVDHQELPALETSPVRGLTLAGVGRQGRNPNIQTVYWLTGGDLKRVGGSLLKQAVEDVREYGAFLLLSGTKNPLLSPVQPSAATGVRRRETIFASFDDPSFGHWTTKGKAFQRPRGGTMPDQNPVTGFLGGGLVNSYDPNDEPQGRMTSPVFVIQEKYISFLVGGGRHPDQCCINLVIDGKVVRSSTGKNTENLKREEWDVSEFANREARIELVDERSDGWGHILVDDIRFSNLPTGVVTTEEAEAWNALIDDARPRATSRPAGVGRGKVMLMPMDVDKAGSPAEQSAVRDKLLSKIASLTGVTYRPQVGRESDAPSFGTMCLATPQEDASMSHDWSDRDLLHRLLADSGRLSSFKLPPAAAGPTEPRRTLNAALCVERNIPPGRAAEAVFIFTWHFPNQYYPQNSYEQGGRRGVAIGSMYDNWYRDALDVARHVVANLTDLRKQTVAYHDALFDTTLPQYFIDAAAANVSIIRSPTCFWAKEGAFYGFEGCRPEGGGCCPMNCNHVWNYEQSLAKLWPALDRDMRKTELKFQQIEQGGTYHRVAVPRETPNRSSFPVADGQCGAVLKAYREHLQSADRRFLDEYWDRIKKAMDFAIKNWDKDGDGLMEQPQFNTYDRDIYGHNTFVTSLYLAALRAAEEMARLCGDKPAADKYRQLFEKGQDAAAKLFDGEYYIQIADNINLGYGKGCWADQVVGQWWACVLNLGDILPNEQVRSVLKAIFKHNWLWKIDGFQGTQRFLQFADGDDKGLLCGSWPKGGRPEDPILYRDECWTGVEYQVAAHKIYVGQIEEGLAIVRGARERYDGTKRSPWNEIECGDYYVRALSSWSLLLAAQGYAYDGPAQRLSFNPRITPDDHRSFFSTADGWGRFEQKRSGNSQTNALAFDWGRCDLRELRFGLPSGVTKVTAKAKLDDRGLFIETKLDKGTAVITLTTPITAVAGNTVTVEMSF